MTRNLSLIMIPPYPLSLLWNGAYPSLAFLFSSCTPPFKFLTPHIPHPTSHFEPHPAKPMLYPHDTQIYSNFLPKYLKIFTFPRWNVIMWLLIKIFHRCEVKILRYFGQKLEFIFLYYLFKRSAWSGIW